jgi:hypothetical protein
LTVWEDGIAGDDGARVRIETADTPQKQSGAKNS